MTEPSAKFLEGSTMRHILVMSGAGSIGLMSLFVVDLLDMLFISMLGQVELAAAVGFAGTLTFFATSVSIGTSIAMGALMSKAIGAKNTAFAKQIGSNVLVIAFFISIIVTVTMCAYIPELLTAIGAEGRAHERASAYLWIIMPSTPLIALGMASGAGLRAAGDAKRSMWATLYGGIVNAILDPLFIFGFGWNVEGAAVASVIARFTVFYFSFMPLLRVHQLLSFPRFSDVMTNSKMILAIALPAIIANTATPIGNAIVTTSIAQFGENFVAGYAVIGRLTPVCFAVIFALSGAVGPIIGQNFGALRIDRVEETLKNSLIVTTTYTIAVCLLLYLVKDYVIAGFSLTGDAALIVATFATYVAITFIFNGALFVANTSFNNLGRPLYSTALNLGKATAGTLPFVYFGAQWFGALGVLYGQALGNIVFGILGMVVLKYHILELRRTGQCAQQKDPSLTSVNSQPFCTHDAVLIEDVAKNKPGTSPVTLID
ncbi:MATE family efflux transporter [Vibrio sp. 10N.286.49.C2]|uniref:MATE family efflux transporter n=1 Tax=unclassified Vibrio TaxID=2614977 RepID=UPI000C81BBA9|nr:MULTISPECIES: MATE family efflux transporter [unclassified Vibrio]PMH35116.1 MATE family efflux transporter [Vibrio sp. 10N.286.49.C2]PMH50920.1 MATE family efflux transporter [Vibrio sp. 10N.286.49.B1]